MTLRADPSFGQNDEYSGHVTGKISLHAPSVWFATELAIDLALLLHLMVLCL
jgi:hypothetical protein